MAICRLMIHAFQGHDNFGYDRDDLVNGIAWAEDLLEMGITKAPHDDINLEVFIAWAKIQRELWAENGRDQEPWDDGHGDSWPPS